MIVTTTKKIVALLIIMTGLAIGRGIVPAAVAGPLDNVNVTLSPYSGVMSWSPNLNLNRKLIYGARAGVALSPVLGIEVGYAMTPAETKWGPTFYAPAGPPPPLAVGASVSQMGLDVVFTPKPDLKVVPYLLAGVSRVHYKSDDLTEAASSYNGFAGAGGFRIPVMSRMAARLEARDLLFKVDSPGAPTRSFNHNFIFTAGLQFSFGGGGGAAGSGADADLDGVKDKDDQCPDTPRGALVDARGCPIDADRDGVPDGIDQCANTPAGAQVDARGCPADTDEDGVPDGIDQCANTPAGAQVDARGCPLDSDRDGVPDGIDQCANTPAGASVDPRGCPMDTDNDGVLDGFDRCPDTPTGAKVDKDGCSAPADQGQGVGQATAPPAGGPPAGAAPATGQAAPPATGQASPDTRAGAGRRTDRETELLDTGRITVREVRFETGKAVIDPASYPVLDEIGRILVQWPELRVEIGGHTDSRGSPEYNVGLSQRRAEAVLNYMLEHFPQISRAQYTARGYGAGQPVASNDTPDGRAQNRRVEFKVLNPEVLAKEKELRQNQGQH